MQQNKKDEMFATKWSFQAGVQTDHHHQHPKRLHFHFFSWKKKVKGDKKRNRRKNKIKSVGKLQRIYKRGGGGLVCEEDMIFHSESARAFAVSKPVDLENTRNNISF